jgi:predicted ATP-grasp superfamily ATP-dependent carboligase
VYLVELDPLTPAFYSRYARARFQWNLEEEQPDKTISFLQSIGRKLGPGAVLLPTSDSVAVFMAENREALAPWFRFPPLSPETAKSLSDKEWMSRLAAKIGVSVPETRFPTTRTDVVDVAATLKFPLILKAVLGRFMPSGKRQFVLGNKEELFGVYDALSNPQNVMVQEYIPGPEDNCWIFHGYFNEKSECLARFTGKKVRQYPTYGGHTCLAICVKNAAVEDMSIRFLKAIGYAGIVDIDVRYDPRDSQYKLLDVNPRIGANSRLFVSPSGLDLARMYYLDMTGQPCTFEPALEGRKWVVEDYDFVSCLRYWWDGNLSLREWLSSLRGIDEYGYLKLNDPLPVFAGIAYDAVKVCRSVKSRVSAEFSELPIAKACLH